MHDPLVVLFDGKAAEAETSRKYALLITDEICDDPGSLFRTLEIVYLFPYKLFIKLFPYAP